MYSHLLTVSRRIEALEKRAAELFEREDAVFVTSGTMSNLTASKYAAYKYVYHIYVGIISIVIRTNRYLPKYLCTFIPLFCDQVYVYLGVSARASCTTTESSRITYLYSL